MILRLPIAALLVVMSLLAAVWTAEPAQAYTTCVTGSDVLVVESDVRIPDGP